LLRRTYRFVLLLALMIVSAALIQTMFPGKATASAEFETVMIGDTKILIRESDEYSGEASVFAVMLAGQGHQEPDETHCAHVAEHMAFRNPTLDGVALGGWVSGLGTGGGIQMMYNGWTGPDHTQFEMTIPGEHLPEALTRLVAGLFPDAIDAAAYSAEIKTRLVPELRHMTTDPLSAPLNAFNVQFYRSTVYSEPRFDVWVGQVKPDNVLTYMKREYSSSRLIITLVGDFDKEAALNAISDAVNEVPSEPGPVVPEVRLDPPPITSFKCEKRKNAMCMLGVGVDSIDDEDLPFVSTILRIALVRLRSQPLDGFSVSESMLGFIQTAASQGLMISYEATRKIGQSEIQAQAEVLSPAAKAVFSSLANEGPAHEEVAELLAWSSEEGAEPEMPGRVPRTLFEAWWRGIREIPGQEVHFIQVPTEGMSEEELTAVLMDTASRYEGRLQFMAMTVEPGSVFSPLLAIGGALAVLAVAGFLVWRRRGARAREV